MPAGAKLYAPVCAFAAPVVSDMRSRRAFAIRFPTQTLEDPALVSRFRVDFRSSGLRIRVLLQLPFVCSPSASSSKVSPSHRSVRNAFQICLNRLASPHLIESPNRMPIEYLDGKRSFRFSGSMGIDWGGQAVFAPSLCICRIWDLFKEQQRDSLKIRYLLSMEKEKRTQQMFVLAIHWIAASHHNHGDDAAQFVYNLSSSCVWWSCVLFKFFLWLLLSALELFLMKMKIKGPSWLSIHLLSFATGELV